MDDGNDVIIISSNDDEAPEQNQVKAQIVHSTNHITTQHTKLNQVDHGLDIMEKLTVALDPGHQQRHNKDWSHCGFEQAQYFTVTMQLRDSQVS